MRPLRQKIPKFENRPQPQPSQTPEAADVTVVIATEADSFVLGGYLFRIDLLDDPKEDHIPSEKERSPEKKQFE